jgi:hypothetical protein
MWGDKMEEWQQKLIDTAEVRATSDAEGLKLYIERQTAIIQKTLEIKKRIIAALREEPDDLFGSRNIFIRTQNHELVHDIVRTLGIKLDRTAEVDGFNFKGEYKGITVCVYGMQKVPHCKIVSKKVRKTVIVYETVCNQEGEKGE